MRQKNPLTFLLSLLLLFVLDFLQRVYADDIAFIEPHMDGVYYAGSSMDIHYKGRVSKFIGIDDILCGKEKIHLHFHPPSQL